MKGFNSILKYSMLLFLGIFLNGCIPERPPLSSESSMVSKDSVQRIETLQSFRVTGVVGLRSPEVNQQGNLNWQQYNQNTYQIRLYGPFGAGAVELKVQPGLASLKTNKTPLPLTSKNPQTLLAQETGWVLPLDSFFYWIRGLANPKLPVTKTYDPQGRLTHLNQEGWEVNYSHFTTVKGLSLPDRISITRDNTHVKLVLKSWEF